MKKYVLLCCWFVSHKMVQSQLAIGPDFSYKYDLVGDVIKRPAFGIHYSNYILHEKVFYFTSLSIMLPVEKKATTPAYAYDPSNPVQQIYVPYNVRYRGIFVDAGFGTLLKGDYEAGGFMVYGGLFSVGTKYSVDFGGYNDADYALYTNNLNRVGIYYSYGLKAGLGYLLRTGSFGINPNVEFSQPLLGKTGGIIHHFLSFGIRICYQPG